MARCTKIPSFGSVSAVASLAFLFVGRGAIRYIVRSMNSNTSRLFAIAFALGLALANRVADRQESIGGKLHISLELSKLDREV